MALARWELVRIYLRYSSHCSILMLPRILTLAFFYSIEHRHRNLSLLICRMGNMGSSFLLSWFGLVCLFWLFVIEQHTTTLEGYTVVLQRNFFDGGVFGVQGVRIL